MSKETDVALISPPAKWMHKDIPYPPLALAYLSAVGNEAGISTAIYDAQFDEFSEKLGDLAHDRPQLVGVSATLMQLSDASQIAEYIKNKNPQAIIVFGGPGPNCIPTEDFFTTYGKDVDLVCRGEGELTWLDLITKFKGSENFSGELRRPAYLFQGVSGTVVKDGVDIIENEPRPLIYDLDSLPMPDLRGIEAQRYIETWRRNSGVGSISIFPSRGCPYSCVFCDKTIFGHRFRHHSPARIADEMDQIKSEFGPVDDIFLFDDNRSTKRQIMVDLCDEIKRRDLHVNWSCQARANTVDSELLGAMYEAGCKEIYFGVEAATLKLLEYLGKKITPEQAVDAIQMSREVGMKTGCFLIVGIPGETEDDITAIEQFITKAQPAYVGFSVLTPFPGTELYTRTRSLIKPSLLNRYDLWDDTRSSVYEDGVFVVNPATSIKRLEAHFKQMLADSGVVHNSSQFVINRYEEKS